MSKGISTIRAAESADIVLLSEYWYDRAALLMQTNPRIRLAPDARARWESAAGDWLQNDEVIFLVGLAEGEITGAIAGRIEANAPGLLPEFYARVLELIIDLHSPHTQQGIGRTLLNAFREQMRGAGIQHLMAQSISGIAVEQAFWRGSGAKSYAELVWMDV